ncbi:hypothetical protein [Oxynema aestuarii]|jgi:hypothetical protein|uniref:Uncharacterized protein n=1 Tax=Oxynema aestuarii AP17 TaxID=2064643 RepID=A0A6H1U1V6_9CYAN|nr:hypothetical protein [Oxynema aestuarii]QIZ72635.1 hypothetical protein HCG48_20250 [Oxynema aestuarii AP17]
MAGYFKSVRVLRIRRSIAIAPPMFWRGISLNFEGGDRGKFLSFFRFSPTDVVGALSAIAPVGTQAKPSAPTTDGFFMSSPIGETLYIVRGVGDTLLSATVGSLYFCHLVLNPLFESSNLGSALE